MEKEEYFLRIGIIRTAPKTLIFFNDLANVSGSILFGVISFLFEKITCKSANDYNRTVSIYKKKGFWQKKELLYEEIIPKDNNEDQVSKRVNDMAMRLKQDKGDQFIKDLIIGRTRIF